MIKRNEYAPIDSSKTFMNVLLAIIILSFLSLPFMVNQTLENVLGVLIPQVAFLGAYFYLNLKQKVKMREASKLRWTMSWKQVALIIAIGLVALYSFSPFVSWFTAMMEKLGYATSEILVMDSTPQFFFYLFAVGILPGICEELIFRGVIFQGLRKRGLWFAVLISGLMFMLMHMSLEQSIYQFVLGIILALVVTLTDSLFSAMILHAFNNTFVIVINFLVGDGEAAAVTYNTVWSNIEPFIYVLVGSAIIVGLLFALKYLIKFENKAKVQVPAKKIEQENISISTEQSPEQIAAQEEQKSLAAWLKKRETIWLIASIAVGVAFWIYFVSSSFM